MPSYLLPPLIRFRGEKARIFRPDLSLTFYLCFVKNYVLVCVCVFFFHVKVGLVLLCLRRKTFALWVVVEEDENFLTLSCFEENVTCWNSCIRELWRLSTGAYVGINKLFKVPSVS